MITITEKEQDSNTSCDMAEEQEKIDQESAPQTKSDVTQKPILHAQTTTPLESNPEPSSQNKEDEATKETILTLKQQITELNQQIIDLKSQTSLYKDQGLRALAEVENVRRRAQHDREDTAKFSLSMFARDVLGIADNLSRAIESIPQEMREQNESIDTLMIGLEAIDRQLIAIFDRVSIKKIDILGKPFDPNFHRAMFEIDRPNEAPGTILQIVRPGYTIHERLLREALVGIVKLSKPEPQSAADTASEKTSTPQSASASEKTLVLDSSARDQTLSETSTSADDHNPHQNKT